MCIRDSPSIVSVVLVRSIAKSFSTYSDHEDLSSNTKYRMTDFSCSSSELANPRRDSRWIPKRIEVIHFTNTERIPDEALSHPDSFARQTPRSSHGKYINSLRYAGPQRRDEAPPVVHSAIDRDYDSERHNGNECTLVIAWNVNISAGHSFAEHSSRLLLLHHQLYSPVTEDWHVAATSIRL